jgi:hypothetical protein
MNEQMQWIGAVILIALYLGLCVLMANGILFGF